MAGMPPYPVYCYTRNCPELAAYKIAARWSDGVTHELKTYSLCCANCLAETYRRSLERQAACHLAPRETLDKPGIYKIHRGQRDRELERCPELEQQLDIPPPPAPTS